MKQENYELLISAATKYYNGEDTGISDKVYDQLLDEAKSSIPGFNIFKVIRYGTDRENINHSIPFIAQAFKEKFSSTEEIIKFVNDPLNENWIITPKWDGSSIRAYYIDGILSDILTRSDEFCGKRKFESLYNKVPHTVNKDVICIDFEALCSREDFGDDPRSNANGLVNSCNCQENVDKYLHLIPFKVTTKTNMEYLDSMNLVFNQDDYLVLDKNTLDYDNRYLEFKGLHYPIDGIVLYKDTISNHRIYKHYFSTIPTSTVTGVEWNFTDKLCWYPKIFIDTIKIDGRNISSATSNGYGRLKELKAGKGAVVEIILANSTIPQVYRVISESEDYEEPKVCPWCGAKIINVNDRLRCSNKLCSNVIDWISYYFQNLLKIENYKISTLDEFHKFIVDMKKLKSVDELLRSLAYSISLERFGKYDLLANLFVDNKSKFLNGTKSLEVIQHILTDNQYYIYETYDELIDKLIGYILENYNEV